MKQSSYFHKGITTDLDYSKLDNMGLVLPTSNIQLLNREGQGLIVTPAKGNTKEFKLSQGFLFFGACEFNGIIYIVSYSPETKEGEIGSYPSPNATGDGFDQEYRPLKNLADVGGRAGMNLRTVLFDFDIKHPVLDQIHAVSDYDGSISLIFTDSVNPLRLVNTGFDQLGKRNRRFYTRQEFVKEISLIKPIPQDQEIVFRGQAPGGRLKHGNYFFFYRYLTPSNDRTPFVAESEPATINVTSSENNQVFTGGDDIETNKKVLLEIKNVDQSFAFIEIAFMRVYSNINDVVTAEIMRVDKLVAITEGVQTISTEITGYETFAPLSISELLRPANNETIAKSIVPYDRRMWGGNWKAKEINHQALRELAVKIRLSCDDTTSIPYTRLRDFYSQPENIKMAGYFRNEAYITGVAFVLKETGYVTERFPVSGIDARNIKPEDILNNYDNSLLTNESGVIVMPSNEFSPYLSEITEPTPDEDSLTAHMEIPQEDLNIVLKSIMALDEEKDDGDSDIDEPPGEDNGGGDGGSDIDKPPPDDDRRPPDYGPGGRTPDPEIVTSEHSTGRVLSLVFNMDQAIKWLATNSKQAKWIKENVSEIIFLRARRKENLIYQGISTRVYGREVRDPKYKIYENNGVSIPIVDDYNEYKNAGPLSGIPIKYRAHNSKNDLELRIFVNAPLHQNWHENLNQSEEEKKIRAVFSTDFIFGSKDKITNFDTDLFVKPIARTIYDESFSTSVLPHSYRKRFKAAAYPYEKQILNPDGASVVFDLNNWIYPSSPKNLQLVNRVDDSGSDMQSTFPDRSNSLIWQNTRGGDIFYDEVNRNILVPPYFALRYGRGSEHTDIAIRYPGTVVSVCRQNPETFNPLSLYADELNLQYSQVTTERFQIDGGQKNIRCFQGDSFVQLTTIKSRTWAPTKERGTDKKEAEVEEIGASISKRGYSEFSFADYNRNIIQEYTKYTYAHGQLLDIVTENAVNTALRFSTPNENRFFPAVPIPRFTDHEGNTWQAGQDVWSLYPYSPEVMGWETNLGTGIEALMVNHGNSKAISLRHYLSYNPNIPKGINVFKNRIRYTGQQEPGYPILSYRLWDYMAKEDFDERYGELNKLLIVFGRLLSFQETSILLHHTNIEESVPSTTGQMIIGVRSILSKTPVTLSRFGTQHPASVRLARSGAYGWDWANEVIWRVVMTEEGNLVALSIDKEQLIEAYVKEIRQKQKTLKDNIVVISPELQSGLLTGYDRQAEEVLFYTAIGSKNFYQTLRFSEKLNGFIGTYDFPVYGFVSNRRDFYGISFKNNSFYSFGTGLPAVFFEKEYSPQFSFIVNGVVGRENYTAIDKLFKAMEIACPKTPMAIEKIEYETLFQKGENNPFYDKDKFWLLPEYLQSKWAFPINKAKSGKEIYESESGMTGQWIKVTVTLNKNTDTFIKHIITTFTISNA